MKIVNTILGTAAGIFAAGVLLAGAEKGEQFKEGELTAENYERWRDHVVPRGWELSYRSIHWQTSFWDAVVEAQKRDKPILLWSMNGHPLCNT